MATPTKAEIVRKATQLFFEYQLRSGVPCPNSPELEELREGGWLSVAASHLMRNHYKDVQSDKNYYTICEEEDAPQSEDLENFPIDQILREGCVIVGGRGCGKTNLLKLLILEALKRKIEVKVFDPSLAWKGFPLPTTKVRDGKHSVESRYNTIYDVSRLSVLEVRKFVADMMARDLVEAIHLTDLGRKPRCLFVLEEAQNVIPSNTLRLLKFQDVSRFISQGRNFGLSYVASTQRLARVDVDLVEISGVKYWFKLEGERNLGKARWWLSKYRTWSLKSLAVGSCLLQVGDQVKTLDLPLFETERVEVVA